MVVVVVVVVVIVVVPHATICLGFSKFAKGQWQLPHTFRFGSPNAFFVLSSENAVKPVFFVVVPSSENTVKPVFCCPRLRKHSKTSGSFVPRSEIKTKNS